MPKPRSNGSSPRDPLSQIRGDPTLDAVWRDVLAGRSSPEGRAALIRHYRTERQRHLNKEATRDDEAN